MTWYVKLQCWGTWEQFISTCRSLYLFHWPAKFFHLLNHNSDIFSLVRPLHVPHQSLTGQITWSYFPHRWYQESANFLYKGSDYNLQAKSSLPHVLVQPPPKKDYSVTWENDMKFKSLIRTQKCLFMYCPWLLYTKQHSSCNRNYMAHKA